MRAPCFRAFFNILTNCFIFWQKNAILVLTSVIDGDILNFVVEQNNLKEQNDEKS